MSHRRTGLSGPTIQKLIAFVIYRTFRFRGWRGGITDFPRDRWVAHGRPKHFTYWPAESEYVARRVEREMKHAGITAGTGGKTHGYYVYIY